MRRSPALLFALVLAFALVAKVTEASPVRWQFTGFIGAPDILELQNARVQIDLTFQDPLVNFCSPGQPTGEYSFGGHVFIYTTLGPLDYTVGGRLYSNTIGLIGCSNFNSHPLEMELRMSSWLNFGVHYGGIYDLPDANFVAEPDGLFWNQALNGGFPDSPPTTARFDIGRWYTLGNVPFGETLSTNVTAVPEPTTLVLILAGLGAVAYRMSRAVK
jgi:hypothetical protein